MIEPLDRCRGDDRVAEDHPQAEKGLFEAKINNTTAWRVETSENIGLAASGSNGI